MVGHVTRRIYLFYTVLVVLYTCYVRGHCFCGIAIDSIYSQSLCASCLCCSGWFFANEYNAPMQLVRR